MIKKFDYLNVEINNYIDFNQLIRIIKYMNYEQLVFHILFFYIRLNIYLIIIIFLIIFLIMKLVIMKLVIMKQIIINLKIF
jgi:hypothetical protein